VCRFVSPFLNQTSFFLKNRCSDGVCVCFCGFLYFCSTSLFISLSYTHTYTPFLVWLRWESTQHSICMYPVWATFYPPIECPPSLGPYQED
jgi:hypothetical protein